ncbi:hypothetical protein NQZ79_g1796 [Umbelopsis isabellina]|nr:hypothetical protein NQZ79_g1796 [Umbelopsis isabellina]
MSSQRAYGFIQILIKSPNRSTVKPHICDLFRFPAYALISNAMKAKACTTCRQRKLKCDAAQRFPQRCSRCNKLEKACLFDPNFKRVSKSLRLQQVEQQLRSIGKASPGAGSENFVASHKRHSDHSDGLEEEFIPCASPKNLADINLTAQDVTDIFRLYFEKMHIYLPFRMIRSVDSIHQLCPLLFWVIVAVASRDRVLVKSLIPHVQRMTSDIMLKPVRNVETVQAILILCLWPFPYSSQLDDQSFFLCGMALHIGLQIGLHRPEYAFQFSSKQDVLRTSIPIRRTTWIACFVVNQMLATAKGVPSTMPQDYNFLVSLDHEDTPPYLGRLGHITRMTATFTNAIGTNASNMHGLCEPHERINLIKLYNREFSNLKFNKLGEMDHKLEVAFLASQLQLFTFALLDDISASAELIDIIQKAESISCKLIQLVSQSDLEFVPVFWSRYVIVAAVILLKILKSPSASNSSLINNQISLAHQIFTSITKCEDDGNQRSDRLLLLFSVLEDKKKFPPIHCRLAASLVYDAIRVSKEYYEEILETIMEHDNEENTSMNTQLIEGLFHEDIGHQ